MNLRALVACGALVVGLGAAAQAEAGKGGSAARIQNAAQSGSEDAIVAEIERAERLICPNCVEPVIELLDHDSYAVREAAAWWIAKRPAQREEVRAMAEARLYGEDSELARNAADILGAFRHPDAIPALEEAAGSSALDGEARAHAVRAVGEIGHQRGSDVLAAAMSDGDEGVRLAAVRAWRGIRLKDHAEPVVARTEDESVRVRREAAGALGALRESAGREALEDQVVSDPDPAARRNAAWALGRIGAEASREALQVAASDDSPLVRRTAEVALGQLK